jgi:peptidoglycan hydrolase-like protein with peptidoglycan-binding domain|tara:strand:+ start:484 stop:810 length:327 start_codon:yes stop_codon:yes gene_type:complete
MDIGKPPLSITNNSNTHAVRHLQAKLNEHGASIFIDGRYAVGTDRAVARFQSDNGLDISGYVTEETWDKLNGKAAKKKAPAKKPAAKKAPAKKAPAKKKAPAGKAKKS